jgi:hypothetical protein
MDFDLDPDSVLHNVGGGAVVAATVTLVRLGLDYGLRRSSRRIDHEDRERSFHRDAEARLERVLQDRLSEADRRLDRCEFEIGAERARRAALQHHHATLSLAHDALKEQYGVLRNEHALLLSQHRLLVEQLEQQPVTAQRRLPSGGGKASASSR